MAQQLELLTGSSEVLDYLLLTSSSQSSFYSLPELRNNIIEQEVKPNRIEGLTLGGGSIYSSKCDLDSDCTEPCFHPL